jgi:hypothetical protein
MSQDRRILALHAKGHDEVEIACRLMIGIRAVQSVVAKAAERLQPGTLSIEAPARRADAPADATSSAAAGSGRCPPPISGPSSPSDRAAPAMPPTPPSAMSSRSPVSSPSRSLPVDAPSERGAAESVTETAGPVEAAGMVEAGSRPGRTVRRPGDWTEDRVAQLRRLWEVDGHSAGQIATMMGDVTRNSVLSKVHRLKLVAPKDKAGPPAGRLPPSAAKAAPEGEPAPWRDKGYRTKPPSRGWASGAGLTDRSPFPTCQYLRGEARDRDFCGAAVLERPDGRRSSYCPEHHALCWQALLPPRRIAAASPLTAATTVPAGA